jgi:Txe/YoeB family toxin of toxin-antitoxin system
MNEVTTMYDIRVTSKLAKKGLKKLQKAGFIDRYNKILSGIQAEPTQAAEKLHAFEGETDRIYSRRINVQHRIVYQVRPADHTVEILSVYGHYTGAMA